MSGECWVFRVTLKSPTKKSRTSRQSGAYCRADRMGTCDPLTHPRGLYLLPNDTEKPGMMRELRHFWQKWGLVIYEHFGVFRGQSVG